MTAVMSARSDDGERRQVLKPPTTVIAQGLGMRADVLLTVMSLLAVTLAGAVIVPSSVAADGDCEGAVLPTAWNESVQRHASVPFFTGGFWYNEWDEGAEDETAADQPSRTNRDGSPVDDTLHPEASWMYNPTWPLPVLDPLTDGVYTTLQVGNDSTGSLRVNLSSTHRTTVCVNLFTVVDNVSQPASADVYLMTSAQHGRYENHYDMMHGSWVSWGDDGIGDINDALSDIPPEWRSVTPNGWTTYRDVHAYEDVTDVTFSVALDGPEIYDSLLGGANWQDFYIVIDHWDNGHDGDSLSTGEVLVADVTLMPVERSLVLPTWTVPLVFFALLAVAVAAPFLLNKRYMDAGLGTGVDEVKQVPTMMQASVGLQSDATGGREAE